MLSSHRLWPASCSRVAAFMLRSRSKSSTSPSRRRCRSSVLGTALTNGVDDLGRDLGAHDACAEREHVDVVVLDHLMARVVVRRVRGPHPGQLVGGDRDAGPAAAHEDAALGVGRVERVGDSLGDERVVDALGGAVSGPYSSGSCPAARTASAMVGRNGSPAWSAAIATFTRTAPKAQPALRRAGVAGGDADLRRDGSDVHEKRGVALGVQEVGGRLAQLLRVDFLRQLLDQLVPDRGPVGGVRTEQRVGRRLGEPLDVGVLQAEGAELVHRGLGAVGDRLRLGGELLRGGGQVGPQVIDQRGACTRGRRAPPPRGRLG